MRAAFLVVGALLLAPATALAQTSDPTVNDSDFNTTPPAPDDAYLNGTNSSSNGTADPTVSDSDFDTTPPSADAAYLDDAARQYGVDSNGTAATSAAAKTPAPGFALLVGAALVAALVVGRGRRSR